MKQYFNIQTIYIWGLWDPKQLGGKANFKHVDVFYSSAWIMFSHAPFNISLVIGVLALICPLSAWNRSWCCCPSISFNLCLALLCPSLLGLDRGLRRCCLWASQGLRAMSCVDQRRWRQRPLSGPSPSPTLSTARCMWSMSWANLQPRWCRMHAGMVSVGLLPPAVGIDNHPTGPSKSQNQYQCSYYCSNSNMHLFIIFHWLFSVST